MLCYNLQDLTKYHLVIYNFAFYIDLQSYILYRILAQSLTFQLTSHFILNKFQSINFELQHSTEVEVNQWQHITEVEVNQWQHTTEVEVNQWQHTTEVEVNQWQPLVTNK